MKNTQFAMMEEHIARSRIMLSVAALISVYVDPTTPNLTQWMPLSGGFFMIDSYALAILGLHLAYATGIYVLASRRSEVQIWTLRTTLSIVMDVLFGVAVAVVTEGATSPSYVFFAFAILAVGCRAGFPTILQATAACVGLYFAVILVSADRSDHVYLMRPAYLAITGYLIAYLAQQRFECELRAREVESRAERQVIARVLHDGYVQALAAVNLRLENCRKLLHRDRRDDALVEIADLQGGVRHEYDEVRAYVRSLADLERRATQATTDEARFSISADFNGSGILVEHVLQIMLEGVRNARRHAQATTTAITARAVERFINITIQDDGVGFDHEAVVPWTIASRAKDCGGDAQIVQTTRKGAQLVVALPERSVG